jgi:peptide/nickel transport system permease protein
LRRLDGVGRASLVVLAALVALALAAPLLPLPDPAETALETRLLAPLSPGHLLGTDQLGRDLLSRLIFAIRLSLVVALIGVTLAGAVGSLLGLVAAHYGRQLDTVLMRGVDVLMAFPYLLLALAIVAALGPGLLNATLAIAIVNVPFFARAVRGAALSVRREEFVEAARAAGASDARVLWVHVAPNVLPVIVIAASSSLAWMIVETAGLSFLGLGAQPPNADLGSLLGRARHLLGTAPHVLLAPGVAIVLLALPLHLLGDALRDLLDPRAKSSAKRAGLESP